MTGVRSWTMRTRISALLTLISLSGFVIIGVRTLGFVRDDWNHYVNMRALHNEHSVLEALQLLASNDWFGAHELRIFFGSFVTHYVIAGLGAAAPFTIYAVQLLMHAASAVIVGWIVWRMTGSQVGAAAAAIVLTYAPTTSQGALWVNNLFFVQPWFLLCLTALILIARRIPRPWMLTLATITGLLCQFSGEATIPVLYGLLAIAAVVQWRESSRWRQRLATAIPITVNLLALSLYLTVVVTRPPTTALTWPTSELLDGYVEGVRRQFGELTDISSVQYGAGSVPFTAVAIIAIIIIGAVSVAALFTASPRMSPGRARLLRLLGCLVFGLLLSFLPMLAGIVTGARTGPDLRYLYVPSQLMYASLVVLLLAVARELGHRGITAYRILVSIAACYFIALTTYNIIDIWGSQQRVDDRIWAQVDALVTERTTTIITFNPNHQYLMAPYHSNAISDFQADWGVAGRISWLHPTWPRPGVFRDAQLLPSKDLALRGYYGDATSCIPADQLSADGPDDVLYVTYDYGPTFSDLIDSPLLVTRDFAEYQRSRDAILASTPAAWHVAAAESACATP